jgi:hypothetical protein
MAKKQLDPTLPIYQIKIALDNIKPLIWRRVQVDDCSLDELHDIIQVSMGWDDEHSYAFVIEGEQYGDLERGGDFDYDAQSVRLSDLVKREIARFRYDYDFGDDWRHTIDIEKTVPAEDGVDYPRCVAGERACPPEDCGGPYGYPYFLEKIEDPDHEEHEDALEWVGDEFDPEEFNLDKVNKELRRSLGYCTGNQTAKAVDDPDDRIKMVFGLTTDDDPLPPINEQNQRKFLDYLKANLAFPIKADCAAASAVTVLGFADPPIQPREGVVCVARKGKSEFQVLLSNIHVNDDDPNFQPVEDYTYWLWEADECDEDEDYTEFAFSRVPE